MCPPGDIQPQGGGASRTGPGTGFGGASTGTVAESSQPRPPSHGLWAPLAYCMQSLSSGDSCAAQGRPGPWGRTVELPRRHSMRCRLDPGGCAARWAWGFEGGRPPNVCSERGPSLDSGGPAWLALRRLLGFVGVGVQVLPCQVWSPCRARGDYPWIVPWRLPHRL